MPKLAVRTDLTDFTVGANQQTQAVLVSGGVCDIAVKIYGDLDGADLTMQVRPQEGGTWVTYVYGGTSQVWDGVTSLTASTSMDSALYVEGYCQFRFSVENAGSPSVTIYIDGEFVRLLTAEQSA
jgi:hypothetical protein